MIIHIVYLSLSTTENYDAETGLLTAISNEKSSKASIGFLTYMLPYYYGIDRCGQSQMFVMYIG